MSDQENEDPIDEWNLKYNLLLQDRNQLAEKCAQLERDLQESQKWEVHWQRENNVIANEAEKFRYERDQLAFKVKKFLDEQTDE